MVVATENCRSTAMEVLPIDFMWNLHFGRFFFLAFMNWELALSCIVILRWDGGGPGCGCEYSIQEHVL